MATHPLVHARKNTIQLSEIEKTKGWLENGRIIPFKDLTDKKLQSALIHAEAQELKYHNRASFFGEIVDNLMAEGEKRGLDLEHHPTEFTIKNAQDAYRHPDK